MKEWLKKEIGALSLKVLMAAVLFLLAIFLFAYMVDEVLLENEDVFDRTVFNYFKKFSSPGFIHLMKTITFFGSSYFLFPAYVLLISWLLLKRKRNEAIDILIIGVSSTVLMFVLKQFFHRHRPPLPVFKALTNYSFPSGHALSSFIFCSVLIFLIWKRALQKKWKWLFSVLLVLSSFSIGISRIVLRYHYASDVLAGFCLGYAWVILSLWIQKKINRSKKNLSLTQLNA
jgi:undecaprenyl-diphosphatase